MARYSKMVAEIMAALDVVFVESAPKQTRVVFLSESGVETEERPEIVDRPRLLSMAGQMVNDHPSRGNRIAFVIADGSGRLEKGWHVRFERASKAAKRALKESPSRVRTNEGYNTDPRNSVGPFYQEIVYLTDSEADESLQTLKDRGPEAVATYLSQWDEGDSPDISTTPPWGDDDDTYKVKVPNAGTYIVFYNTRMGYIGLAKILSREEYRELTHESRSRLGGHISVKEASVEPASTTQPSVQPTSQDWSKSPYLKKQVTVQGEGDTPWSGTYEDLMQANVEDMPEELLTLKPGETVKVGGGAAPTFTVSMLEGTRDIQRALSKAKQKAQRTNQICYVFATAYGFTVSTVQPPKTQVHYIVSPDGKVQKAGGVSGEQRQRRTESTEPLYGLVVGDGYLYGVSTEPSAKNFGFWGYSLEEDDEPWAIVKCRRPQDEPVVQALLKQGSSEQVYSDGYDAWSELKPYVLGVMDYNREIENEQKMFDMLGFARNHQREMVERVDINDIPDYSVQTFTVVSDNRKEIDLVAQSITKNSSLKVKGQPREKDGEFLLPVEAHLQAGSADPTQEGIDMIQDAIAQAGIQQESIQVETVRVVGSATDGTWVFVRADEGEYSSLVGFVEALVKADSTAFPQIEKTPALKKVALLVSMEAAADPAAAESVVEHALTEGYAGVNPKDFFEEGVVEHKVWIKAQKALREDTQETVSDPEAPAEMDAGLVQWVRDYIKARHYGNVNLARSIKTNIDRRIKEKGLNAAEVYNVFGDPDDPKQKAAVLKAVGIQ